MSRRARIHDEYDTSDSKSMSELIDKVSRTQKGGTITQELFFERNE